MLAGPGAGACIERDSVLRALSDNAETEEGAARRIRLFEDVFGPHEFYAATLPAGAPVPEAWLRAVVAHGARPLVTVEDQPGVDWRPTVEQLGIALGGLDCEAWVSLFPLRERGSSAATLARSAEAALLVRRLAPRTAVIRAVDSRAASAAAEMWGHGGAYDACGIEIAVGHAACEGPRDVSAELERFLAVRPPAKTLIVTRLSVARECSRCKARFPEAAANRLAGLLATVERSLDPGIVVVDSSDTVAAGGAYDFGLLASGVVADAYRDALPRAADEERAKAAPAKTVPSDPTARWTLMVLVFGVSLVAGALWLAGRLRPAVTTVASPSGGGRWGCAGGLLIAAGVALLAYPWLTGVLGPVAVGGETGARARHWFRPPGAGEAGDGACRPPFRLEVPAIGLSEPVGEGASVENLRSGPMHYTGTALPGEPSNCCVAGHRSTYGAPFRRLLELDPGDEVVVSAVGGGFRRSYRVAWVRAVDAADGRYLAPTETEALTLSTCHPFGMASERLMLRAYPGAVGSAAAHTRPLDERFPRGTRRLFTRHGLTPGSGETRYAELGDPPSSESAPAGIAWAEERRDGSVVPRPSVHWTPPRLLPPSRP